MNECDWSVSVSFSLPYLTDAPSLAAAPGPAADSDLMTGNSADVMTRVMSQVIAQMADGQIVS